jgi:hypothetical protein
VVPVRRPGPFPRAPRPSRCIDQQVAASAGC